MRFAIKIKDIRDRGALYLVAATSMGGIGATCHGEEQLVSKSRKTWQQKQLFGAAPPWSDLIGINGLLEAIRSNDNAIKA